ncbi:MAG: hypothetical protein GY859_00785 [Desulfobacterales bacterium]|nr:hypothetical protein [Desulfobacterales bacterium]
MEKIVQKEAFTKKCFEAALEVASENETAEVVHAWIVGPEGWLLHAWGEIGDNVLDLTEARTPFPRKEYYQSLGVVEERLRRYSRLEFFELFAEHGHLGPFDKAFFYAEASKRNPLTI